MGLLRRLGWAVALVALGAVLATTHVDGKTPLQHLEALVTGRVWHKARGLLLASKPVEHHSPEDRDALNKLIAKRAAP